jgi:hypothetical protein
MGETNDINLKGNINNKVRAKKYDVKYVEEQLVVLLLLANTTVWLEQLSSSMTSVIKYPLKLAEKHRQDSFGTKFMMPRRR